VQLFRAADELIAIHLGHQKITQDEIESTGSRALQNLERLLWGLRRDDAVTACFKQEATDREDLFIVVYAEDRFLGTHAVSLLPDAVL